MAKDTITDIINNCFAPNATIGDTLGPFLNNEKNIQDLSESLNHSKLLITHLLEANTSRRITDPELLNLLAYPVAIQNAAPQPYLIHLLLCTNNALQTQLLARLVNILKTRGDEPAKKICANQILALFLHTLHNLETLNRFQSLPKSNNAFGMIYFYHMLQHGACQTASALLTHCYDLLNNLLEHAENPTRCFTVLNSDINTSIFYVLLKINTQQCIDFLNVQIEKAPPAQGANVLNSFIDYLSAEYNLLYPNFVFRNPSPQTHASVLNFLLKHIELVKNNATLKNIFSLGTKKALKFWEGFQALNESCDSPCHLALDLAAKLEIEFNEGVILKMIENRSEFDLIKSALPLYVTLLASAEKFDKKSRLFNFLKGHKPALFETVLSLMQLKHQSNPDAAKELNQSLYLECAVWSRPLGSIFHAQTDTVAQHTYTDTDRFIKTKTTKCGFNYDGIWMTKISEQQQATILLCNLYTYLSDILFSKRGDITRKRTDFLLKKVTLLGDVNTVAADLKPTSEELNQLTSILRESAKVAFESVKTVTSLFGSKTNNIPDTESSFFLPTYNELITLIETQTINTSDMNRAQLIEDFKVFIENEYANCNTQDENWDNSITKAFYNKLYPKHQNNPAVINN